MHHRDRGSLNVIAVNGWMNHPQGFEVDNGQVVDPAPWTALFNANLWHEFVHMYLAGYLVAGFIVAGVYAYAPCAGGATPTSARRWSSRSASPPSPRRRQLLVGDWAGRTVAENQPIKLAAIEGLPARRRARPFTSAASTTRTRTR